MKSVRTLITIVLLFTAATLFAQVENRPLMKVNIPFAFAVGDRSLPAGEYLVLTVTPERSIRLASTDGKQSAIVNTLPNYGNTPSSKTGLVFHKYGSEYFLVQVRTAGQNLSRDPLSSKRAMEIAATEGIAGNLCDLRAGRRTLRNSCRSELWARAERALFVLPKEIRPPRSESGNSHEAAHGHFTVRA